ncbi:MAG: siphovirus ReqiPepy6 Gp37-like family protein [Prevotella sp.]|nr:siphovirus ReqiPepy6 Gp37-like family protein [Prevotella sp.]
MLLREIEISVFKLDNTTFEAIGQINQFTSLIWPDKFNGYSTFELNAPVNAENRNLIKKGNIVWCGGDNAAVIEIIDSSTNDAGQQVYKVKGRTLEMILTTRIIWGTYACESLPASTVMYEIVDKNFLNTVIVNRRMPFFECAPDEQFGKVMSFQRTGGEVYDAIQNIATDSELGFCILFRPNERKLIFKVLRGVDRTGMQQGGSASDFVAFSTDLDDILSSSYYTNNQDIKTVALVAGEGEGQDRVFSTAGDAIATGFSRREMYVDARDIQSTIMNDDGTETSLSFEAYRDMLEVRGDEKLSERIETESFDAKMRVMGNVQYEYGVDYYKGDKVIVQDANLGIQIVAVVSESCEYFDDKYALDVTFGFSHPTLFQKIKQQTS